MGLQEIYDHEDTFAEARGTGEQGNENGECISGDGGANVSTPDGACRGSVPSTG